MRIFKLFLVLIISIPSLSQNPVWKKDVFNKVLTFNIPTQSDHKEMSYVKAIGGQIDSIFFGFQYYDTVFRTIKNGNEFRVALIGFINGRTEDPSLKKYDVIVVDTILNGTKGLMARYTTNDTTKNYKQVYYYVTMANNQFYWFYVYTPWTIVNDKKILYFFGSIKFHTDTLKEKPFSLSKVYLSKKAE